MLIKTIVDKNEGRKWDIYKESDNKYFYNYSEYFSQSGWRIFHDGKKMKDFYTKDAIEYEFDIIVK